MTPKPSTKYSEEIDKKWYGEVSSEEFNRLKDDIRAAWLVYNNLQKRYFAQVGKRFYNV